MSFRPVWLAGIAALLGLLACISAEAADAAPTATVLQGSTWLLAAQNIQEAVVRSRLLKLELADASKAKSLFSNWHQFNRRSPNDYAPDTEEYESRFKIWKSNMDKITEHNERNASTFWRSGNEFTDMTFDEFKTKVLLPKLEEGQASRLQKDQGNIQPDPRDKTAPNPNELKRRAQKEAADARKAPPPKNRGRRALQEPTDSLSGADAYGTSSSSSSTHGRRLLQADVDWRTSGKVTPVRSQGSCGSCWAFAAAGAVESAYLIAKGSPKCEDINLAEQQLVRCTGNGADCGGGWSQDAYEYIRNTYLVQETLMPYTASDGSCSTPAPTTGRHVSTSGSSAYYTVAPFKYEYALQAWVARSPVVIYWDVDEAFRDYGGGVYTPSGCGTATDHAMLAVGYVTSGATDYWIIKNSWGTGWGESGYIRVKMTHGFPLLDSGPCGMYNYGYAPPMTFDKSLMANCPPPPRPPSPPPRFNLVPTNLFPRTPIVVRRKPPPPPPRIISRAPMPFSTLGPLFKSPPPPRIATLASPPPKIVTKVPIEVDVDIGRVPIARRPPPPPRQLNGVPISLGNPSPRLGHRRAVLEEVEVEQQQQQREQREQREQLLQEPHQELA